jgi:uncharacterized protein YegL
MLTVAMQPVRPMVGCVRDRSARRTTATRGPVAFCCWISQKRWPGVWTLTGLRGILKREPLQLEGLEFQKLFSWLSASLRSAAHAEIFDPAMPLPAIDWQKIR